MNNENKPFVDVRKVSVFLIMANIILAIMSVIAIVMTVMIFSKIS